MTAIAEGPLTYAQQLLLQLERAQPGSVLGSRFIIREAYRIDGEVDEGLLQRALTDVIARHGALRTVLVGQESQRVFGSMPGRLAVHDLDGDDRVAGFVARVSALHYPADDLPLLHAHLGRYADGTRILVLVAPHVAADAWSLRILVRDLARAYGARLAGTEPFPEPAMQYLEVAEIDHSAKWQATIAAGLPYWRDRLAGTARLGLAVPSDRSPGPSTVVRFDVDAAVWDNVRAVARGTRSTPFTVLLTAFIRTLFRPGEQALVPVLTAGRLPIEWDTVGFLLNMLWMRAELPGAEDLGELHRRVDQACREAYARDIPVLAVLGAAPELAAALAAPATTGLIRPVFQFIPRMPVTDPAADPVLRLTPIPDDRTPELPMRAPLVWSMRYEDGLRGYVTYDRALFDPQWLADRLERFCALLAKWDAG